MAEDFTPDKTDASGSPGKQASSIRWGKPLIWVAAIALAGVAGAGWYQSRPGEVDAPQSNVTPPMVVVLDSAMLAMQRLDRVREQELDKEQVQAEAQSFANELGAILAEYEEEGIVVLNKSVVLSAPTQFDITPLVAERMGLEPRPSLD